MLLQCIKDKQLSPAGISMKIPAFIFILLLSSVVTKGADLYWIGGSGKWSDINHWSLSSGNSGGQLSPSIPQSGDHVIFDLNSGFTPGSKTVNINQESSCHDFTVTGVSEALIFEGHILNIYGSADFQTGTILNNTMYLKSRDSDTVDFNSGVSGYAAIYFLGSGSYLISGSLKSNGRMYFLRGSLDFGSSVITTSFFDEGGCCGTVPAPPVEPRSLNLGSSIFTLTGRNSQSNSQSPSWKYTGNTLITGNSQINLSKSADDGYGVSFMGKNGHAYNHVNFTSTVNPLNPSPSAWYQVAGGNSTFKKLSFAGSGLIASNCTIDTLKLGRSRTYYIYGTQQIGTIQNPTANCEPLWTLSGFGNTQATIKSSHPLNLQNVRLNYLKAVGSELFSVNNGVDGGQNSGWVFVSRPKDFYWIGGGGNWNDPTHWTTHNDGTPSGGCQPTRYDNVFFNRFSGKISSENPVIINSSDAECKNISWNDVPGSPVFKTATPKNMLGIFGSCTWQKGLIYQIATTHYMSIDTGNTLTSNEVKIQGDTYFLTGGQWTFKDTFSSPENDIVFRNGHLNTNSQAVIVKNFGSTTSGLGVRTLTLGNSVITVNGDWGYINFGGSPIHLDAGSSQINMASNNAYFYYNSGLTYHNLTFTSTTGTSSLSSTLYSLATPCTFNKLTFASSGFINAGGHPTPLAITHLSLAASKKYILGTNMEIKVSNFTVDGPTCSGLLELGSNSPGTRARLNLLHPTTLMNAKISDINAIGSPLKVTGGLDGGNNLNVTTIPHTSRNFYWIGGNGNWSDLDHWTSRADGTPDSTNPCLPTAMDHVFFNKFSGTNYTVNIDVPANCNNMTWEDVKGSKPKIKALQSNPLDISGSLILQAGMHYDVERTNFISANAGNTITTNNVVMGYTAANATTKGVFFNSTKGTWMLTDVFNVRNFGVTSGTFDTNNHPVNAENYCSETISDGFAAILSLGSSVINIAGYWDGASIKILNAGTSTINMNGTMSGSNSSGGGVSNNEFRSRAGLVYSDLNFLNEALAGKIAGYDAVSGNTFNNVSFAGESRIDGSHRFNILTLGTNKDAHLMSGSTQTVNRLISHSSCKIWEFNSIDPTLRATVKSTSDISLSHVRMSGIEVMGGAHYSAKGIDQGNNSGWDFSLPETKNLYWIGGSGSWSDPSHWTTNADGTFSGGCLPSRFDNVFFNEHSGESPVINGIGIAEFHNMTWNGVHGKPTISMALACYGSMTLQSSLTHYGAVQFLSEEESTITTNGAVVGAQFDVQFSGTGTYTLIDDFTTNAKIRFTRGTLNTNGKTLKALSFTGIETEDHPLSLQLGASKIYLTYDGEGWSYTGSHLDAGTSHIKLIQAATNFKGKDGASYHAITFDAGENSTNRLYGSISVDKLTFSSKNSIYQIQAGKTVTIGNQLQMSGNNCSTVQVQSTTPGTQANVCLQGGNTTYNYISLKDINASCLPLTILAQSTNGGNTTHINFQPSAGEGIGALGPDIKICAAHLPFTLDGTALMPNDNSTIEWTNVTTGKVIGAGIKQTVTTGGTYRIKVVYGPNCEVTDDIVLTIDPVTDLAAHIKLTQPTCLVANGTLTITAVPDVIYSVDGSPYSSILYYELSTGQHTITAKNNAGCISDILLIAIDPLPLPPTASISYGSTKFTASGKIDAIQTGTSGGTFSSFPLGLIIDPITGTIDLSSSTPDQSYTITYTFSGGGCTGSTTTAIKINPTPAAIAYPLSDYCAVGVIHCIQTGPKNGSYASIPAGLSIDRIAGTIVLSESIPGMYEIIYTYQDGSIQKTVSTTLIVNPLPKVSISSSLGTELLKGQTITLTASGGISYAWVGPSIQSGHNTESIKITPQQTTTYKVIATNTNGCTSLTEFTITVIDKKLPIPNNVITPGNDGKNDTWIIKNIEYYPNNSVRIFDRAGRLLYSKSGYSNDWDGTIEGKLLHEDAYIYIIEPGNNVRPIKGTVSIIREHQ
ncbi:gliding motility-associated C-terminal domain-containing protein [Chryseobacterium herbae]|uniref:Gliding motility-associated C-terminal domain-containing protein n=1 Tax=Chryseobacterium herbae TaxID=2976476 RepID=A0ABT2ISI2_9FLAO|nr:gliding motility-associated C-terminal domain-containing protein [Chryseobacterium sp. pc1-10]MCT2561778.1 gliding motility-associated C-terminal domain-containing protein [Chryseobacterium sp. pc1-10]